LTFSIHNGIINAKKALKMEFIRRFFHPPRGSFFLFGPRGTGKSTWLKITFRDALFVDLLDPETIRSYASYPESLINAVEALPEDSIVVIDEIQKLPELLDVVHLLMERKGNIRFVLTGSSARKLKRAGIDLLAGRAAVRYMHPFMAEELRNRFSLEDALKIGLIPLVVFSPDPYEALRAYVSLYINEEVKAEGFVRKIGDFGRFLEAIAFSHASVLNLTEVARECQVKRKTVEGYVSILEDLLIGFKVPVFTKRAKRHMSAHPKFYLFDAGVFRVLRRAGPLDVSREAEGAALEGLIAQHLRAWIDYGHRDCQLYFWRTRAGNEVDFVVYGPDTFVAVEVKNAQQLRNKDLVGLVEFQKDYSEAMAVLLYRGRERLKMKGIPCIPCELFLRALDPRLSMTEILKESFYRNEGDRRR